MYSDSLNMANLLLIVTSCSPRPSAAMGTIDHVRLVRDITHTITPARRLSKGMMNPRAFFQLEMQGGTFHACWSSTVILRGGECSTGTGGDGGPRGVFVFLCLGGSMGSTCASTILITRCFAAGLNLILVFMDYHKFTVRLPQIS